MLWTALLAPAAAGAEPIDLRGEVNRGETIVHPFEHHGVQYEFRMAPIGSGWTVWLGEPIKRDRNFVTAATRPYHGINPAVIQGWHFRNADNTGPNEPGKGNVNAPQKERRFSFVLNAADYHAARESLEILLGPEERSDEEIAEANIRLKKLRKGFGVMWIEAIELGNLIEGEQAHIERLAFRVRLTWP